MKKKILSLALTLCMLISLMPGFTVPAAASDETVYPYYVITKGADATEAAIGNFHVYKKADSAGSFEAFTTSADADTNTAYSTIDKAVTAVTTDVTSDSGSATLHFGLTGMNTSAEGTLDLGSSGYVNLGTSGTYTLKGKLTDSDDSTLSLDGASVNIDGASIQNSSEYYTIENNGSGSITVSSGTVEATGDGNAIYNYGDGDITVSGGTVRSQGDDVAIQNNKSGDITVSGGTVNTTGDSGAINCNGNSHITVSGGTVESTGASNSFIYAICVGEKGITVSSGKIYCKNGPAIFNPKGGTVDISGAVWNEADGTGTLVQSEGIGCISTSGPITITGGTVSAVNDCIYSSAATEISGGAIEAGNGAALCVDGATCRISGGTLTSANTTEASVASIDSYTYSGTVCVSDFGNADAKLYISGGSVTNTVAGYPAICNVKDSSSYASDLYLSGSPAISGSADIWTNNAIHASDGTTPYTGNSLEVEYGGTIASGTTAMVSDITTGTNDGLFSIANTGYHLALNSSDLIIYAAPTAGGITAGAAAKTTPENGKVMLSFSPAAATEHKLYYRVVESKPIAPGVGDVFISDGWTQITGKSPIEVAAADGNYIELVEVKDADSTITQWGKTAATNDGYHWADYAATGFAAESGDGSSSTAPYLISTPEQLAYLAKMTNEGTDYSGKYFELTADLNLSAHSWAPIGGAPYKYTYSDPDYGTMTLTSYRIFAGSFDGKNHIISGLSVNNSSQQYVGLFGRIGQGSLCNLGLKNVALVGNNYTGALAGDCSASVSNCWASGSVTGQDYTGGLMGLCVNPVSYSWSSANVSGASCTGGLVGSPCRNVKKCYATGQVTGSIRTGGLIGYFQPMDSSGNINVSDCYASGNVSGTDSTGGCIGLISSNPGLINHCYASGNVSSSTDVVGGFIGEIVEFQRIIKNSFCAGVLTGIGGSATRVGSFAGLLEGDDSAVLTCYYKDNSYPGASSTGIGIIEAGNAGHTCSQQSNASFYSTLSTYTTAGNWTDVWDMDNVWIIESGASYPTLRNMPVEPIAASGITASVAAKTTPENGKVMLTISTAVNSDGNHKIYYRVVDSEPSAPNVGDSITIGNWTENTNGISSFEVAAADGKYIEVVEISTADSKISKWGKTAATDDGYTAASGGGSDYTPSRTITVTETSSDLFSGSEGQIKAEANMTNAFSNSVEVKVTDTTETASDFSLGAGNKIYPFDISLYIKGTNTKTEPKDGYAVTISLPVPDKLLDVKDQLSIMHKSNDGTVATLNSQLKQINGVWYLVFDAVEFSPYALVVKNTAAYDESAGLPYYVDSDGNEVFIGFAANGKYIAPSGVTVLFKDNAKAFTDTGSHWAKDYIEFVTERELFNGTGNNRFSPDTGMTRAMFATVIGHLYERSYGEIETLSVHAFTDCNYDDYYGKYVDWAAEKGIIGGYGNGKFGPDDQVTREQMAAILHRFADFLGVVPSDMNTALNYPDASAISSWAQSAALYCQTTGIITGRDGGNFVPQGTATRAEVAVILKRFIENTLD